ncbi:MAG: DUF456 family protein [Desulfobacteraceae bacterium]|jgi:uncharacterized protein YqgC (DUF456 family)|nr:DUF456 family protein [Desulfobacteraceae bacterium]
MALDILLWTLAVVLVTAGIAGLLFPVLPGAPMVFAGLVLAAWAEDFAHVGPVTLTVLAAMAALTYVADFLAGAFGAKTFGASRRAVFGAMLGAVVGVFFGIPGVLLGPFIGAFLGELSARRGLKTAGRAGFGAALGLALGIAAKLALALAMVGIFIVVRLFQ